MVSGKNDEQNQISPLDQAGGPAGLSSTTLSRCSVRRTFVANPAGSLGQKHHISTLDLRVYYQNVHGLRTKVSEPYANVLAEEYDLVVLTWLTDGFQDAELLEDRFIIVRNDRKDGRRGGGILVGVRKNLSMELIPINISNDSSLEAKLLPDGSYNYCCGTGGQVHDEDFAGLDPGFQLILKRLDKVDASLSAIKSDIQSSSNKLTELEKKVDTLEEIVTGKPTIVKSIVADNQLNENDEDTE
ncbi:unnamed protein product [Acanthoscelides obtectus]|uniref:Uncharacterized protein n=1 Tax=Acanthoscelides obtectus TaxID=200917 RepID=A0A9P0PN47_ACAOB|nr:unnamed protein product [Acanthoscelides obtectus]CAK1670645.1 hypothetical protein AOBTE_LOCUS27731 [Acanthoscelides obtectus]